MIRRRKIYTLVGILQAVRFGNYRIGNLGRVGGKKIAAGFPVGREIVASPGAVGFVFTAYAGDAFTFAGCRRSVAILQLSGGAVSF